MIKRTGFQEISEMEAYEEDSGGNASPPTFGRTLQDDTAEYMLFMLDDSQEETAASPSKPLAKLDQLRKSALHLSDKLTKGYIWQRDRFDVEVVSRNGTYLCFLYFCKVRL